MKAKELMIGDWCRIESIPAVFCLYKMKAEAFRGAFNFESIPLTKEILEANGWDVEDSCYAWYKIDNHLKLCFYWYEHRLTRHYKGIDEWQNHAEVNEITHRLDCLCYVHEFQQALRLCGLRELADNFKIE